MLLLTSGFLAALLTALVLAFIEASLTRRLLPWYCEHGLVVLEWAETLRAEAPVFVANQRGVTPRVVYRAASDGKTLYFRWRRGPLGLLTAFAIRGNLQVERRGKDSRWSFHGRAPLWGFALCGAVASVWIARVAPVALRQEGLLSATGVVLVGMSGAAGVAAIGLALERRRALMALDEIRRVFGPAERRAPGPLPAPPHANGRDPWRRAPWKARQRDRLAPRELPR